MDGAPKRTLKRALKGLTAQEPGEGGRAAGVGTGFGATDYGAAAAPHAKPHSLWDQTFQDGSMERVIEQEARTTRNHRQAENTAETIYRERLSSHAEWKALAQLIPQESRPKSRSVYLLSLSQLAAAAIDSGKTPDDLEQAVAEASYKVKVTPKERFQHAVSAVAAVAPLMQPQDQSSKENWEVEIATRFNNDDSEIDRGSNKREGWFAGAGCAIDPKCQFKVTWDVCQIFFLVYCAVFVPLRVCWEQVHQPWEQAFVADLVVDLFFLFDLLINCFTGYKRADDGKMQYKIGGKHGILSNYLKGWFTVDFLSIIPVNYISLLASDDNENNELQAIKLLRFLRLIRLMRLAKVKRVMERYESLLGLINTIEFIKLVIMVFFVGHFLCCFWYAVGIDEESDDGEVIHGWRTEKAMGNTTMSVQYITALYWSLTTMTTVGYGDISAYTNLEKLYAVIAMLIGGFAFGLIVGSLTNIISSSNPAETLRKARLSEIASWMSSRQVPQELRDRVYLYYRTLLLHKVGIDEQALMRELPHFLAEPLMSRLYEPIMGSPEEPMGGLRCWKQLGLDSLPHQDQIEICTRMVPFEVSQHTSKSENEDQLPKSKRFKTFKRKKKISKEEERAIKLDRRVRRHAGYIYRQGEDDDRSIYFIRDGHIELFVEPEDDESEDGCTSIVITKGDYFGQMCLSWLKEPSEHFRMHSARAITDAKLYMLNRSALLELEERCPLALQRLKPASVIRQEKRVARAMHHLRIHSKRTDPHEELDQDHVGADLTVASEHRVAAIVTQQVMAAMSDQPASLASPKRFGVLPAIESPARAYKGPLLPTEDSPRVDVLDRKVDKLTEDVGKLTEEIGGIKILLKKLAGER